MSTPRYEIREEIGRGGMGVVYRAYDRRRREEVAVKTLQVGQPEARYRFKREFRALAGVVHPNLVALYGLEETPGGLFIAMELVRGVDFVSHVRPSSSSRGTTAGPDYAPEGTTAAPASPIAAAPEAMTAPCSDAGPRSPPGAHAPLGAEGEARLRAALDQLAAALHTLHSAGKLHCDVKPHNVLVTPGGRVVVLDFGLVAELTPTTLERNVEREIAGTAAYMAPEQLRPAPLTPAVDWYAFGVLLYEALTGRLPFEGGVTSMLHAKQHRDPLPPRAIAPDVPADLSDLCVELLRRSPAERPEAAEIFAWLGGGAAALSAPSQSPRSVFVGRAAELAALEAMFQAMKGGRAVTAFLHGASGAGKSALVRRFLTRLGSREARLVLAGRCHEHEAVPFKALDGVIDRLSQYLLRLPPGELGGLLPEDAHLLVASFPVLGRVPALASAPARAACPDPQELRRRAFAALRELFRRLGAAAPLVIFIDDIQWGDADSSAFLLELFSSPPPRLLLIACCRSEDLAAAPALQPLLAQWKAPAAGHDAHRLELGALSVDETRELAQAALGGAAAGSPELADSIAAEAEGSPLFAQELATHALLTRGPKDVPATSIRLDDVLRARIALLSPEERRLLELLSIAGHPVLEEAAERASGAEPAGRRQVARLRSLHLVVRRGTDPDGPLEPYHDRVRRAAVAAITPDAAKAYHLTLARALSEQPEIDPEMVADHYRKGGAPAEAARLHMIAAERAEAALAFSRAAALHRAALEAGLSPQQAFRTRVKMAEALALSGNGKEAARSFAEAARERAELPGPGVEALDLRRKAAEHYLRSGHIDEGLAHLRDVLARTGAPYPKTAAGALLSLMRKRARLRLRGLGYTLRDPAQISAEERVRVETYWSAGLGLSMVDSIRAAYFQTCHELAALDLGEPVNVARGLCSHVAALGSEGGAANRRRCQQILETAESLARRIDDPSIVMLAHFCAGTAAYFAGSWRLSVERFRAAQQIGRARCAGVTWEMNSAELLELWALAYRGDMLELSRRLPRLLKEARERDDVFAETGLLVGLPGMVWLAQDRPGEAEERAAAAMSRWTSSGFHSQHYFALVGRAQAALYRGDGPAALRLLEEAWPRLTSALLLRLQGIRVELRHLRGRAALAAAGYPVANREELLRDASEDASAIAKEDMPWAAPLAALLEAGAAARRGHRREAMSALGRAARGFDSLEMALYAAAARLQRARLAGRGEDGEPRAWMQAQGIVDPIRMADMLAPGFKGAG